MNPRRVIIADEENPARRIGATWDVFRGITKGREEL
jgi:hypothetical protein